MIEEAVSRAVVDFEDRLALMIELSGCAARPTAAEEEHDRRHRFRGVGGGIEDVEFELLVTDRLVCDLTRGLWGCVRLARHAVGQQETGGQND